MSLTIRAFFGCCIALSACATSPLDSVPGAECITRVAVSAGTTPQFSWSSGCRVQRVAVTGGLCDQFVCWQIDARQTNSITSAVRYGTVPGSGTQVIAPAVLVAGESYTVSISRAGAGSLVVVATQDFTP